MNNSQLAYITFAEQIEVSNGEIFIFVCFGLYMLLV